MSREYETWEVIKLIGENPTWKFQTKLSNDVMWEAFSRSDNKGVRCIYGKGLYHETEDFLVSDSNTMTRKWNKVKESVDFMTAFGEWYLNDRNIMCILDGTEYRFSKNKDIKFCASQISRGKWYVED